MKPFNKRGNQGDRMKLIKRTGQAMDKFGHAFGSQRATITLRDIEDLKRGMILAIEINGGEYSQFIALIESEVQENACSNSTISSQLPS